MNSYTYYTSVLEQIKDQFTLQDALSRYVPPIEKLSQRGNIVTGCCPLADHKDDTPSWRGNLVTGKWRCWGCNQWGDPSDLVAKVLGRSLKDTFQMVAADLGITRDQSPEAKQAARQAMAERQEQAELSATAERLIKEVRQHYSHLERITNAALRSCRANSEAVLNHDWFWRLLEMRENSTHILDLLQGMTEEEAVEYALLLRKEGLCGL